MCYRIPFHPPFEREESILAKSPGKKPSGSKTSGQSRARLGARALQPGFAARHLAATAMRRVLRERRSIEDAMALAGSGNVAPGEAALARAILTVTFRRMGSIRAVMAARLKDGGMPEAGFLAEILITAIAQVLFMEVADHAAVDIAVELAKADRLAMHYAPLANALLRRIATDKASILNELESQNGDAPGWLLERWSLAYGADIAQAIARAHLAQPHIDLTAMGDRVALQAQLGGTLLPNGSLRLETSTPVHLLDGYAEGTFFVQDAAASLPARLIHAKPGMRILDLCAAPGGKTAQLVSAGAEVVAVERSTERARRLAENLERLKLSAEIIIADAGTITQGGFDAVLLDAPCSATGTIRRHPEVAWTKSVQDILSLAREQARLLNHAATLVRPGGLLVYVTCSLEPEEGERQIERFLANQPGFIPSFIPQSPAFAALGRPAGSPYLRILPTDFADFGGCDGFFAAGLQRIT
jgi:16S rRNA (cytosine967-C5)-methyltransferase